MYARKNKYFLTTQFVVMCKPRSCSTSIYSDSTSVNLISHDHLIKLHNSPRSLLLYCYYCLLVRMKCIKI